MDILYTVGEGEDRVDQKIKLNLYDVLDKVTNYNIVYNKVYTISDECKLKLRPPTNIMLKDDKDEGIRSIREEAKLLLETPAKSGMISMRNSIRSSAKGLYIEYVLDI